ncbi:hypothetical protein HMPREF0043_01779 [Actinobaculum sp. oral taxon 183 str. F0552]|nr:hypothetical protein HMPREF0043_01779 [Actinobaculum sp. oral taxon 183 str. F0552]
MMSFSVSDAVPGILPKRPGRAVAADPTGGRGFAASVPAPRARRLRLPRDAGGAQADATGPGSRMTGAPGPAERGA